jgi:hypothetical protein
MFFKSNVLIQSPVRLDEEAREISCVGSWNTDIKIKRLTPETLKLCMHLLTQIFLKELPNPLQPLLLINNLNE